jgi:hypothetical protein
MKHTLFLGGEYIVISSDNYFFEKYKEIVPTFQLENTADHVLGSNWKTMNRPIVNVFRDRLFKSFDLELDQIHKDDVVLYGKVYENNKSFRLSELVLLSEIAFNKSLDQFDKLKKENKIKILTF